MAKMPNEVISTSDFDTKLPEFSVNDRDLLIIIRIIIFSNKLNFS